LSFFQKKINNCSSSNRAIESHSEQCPSYTDLLLELFAQIRRKTLDLLQLPPPSKINSLFPHIFLSQTSKQFFVLQNVTTVSVILSPPTPISSSCSVREQKLFFPTSSASSASTDFSSSSNSCYSSNFSTNATASITRILYSTASAS